MANYREDFANVELQTGKICRNFMNHTIGSGDALGDRFGVHVFRDGEPVTLGGSCAGYFVRNTTGETIVISGGVVSGNEAYVTLPAACYAVEGSFTLAIKVTSGDEVVTLRIVDGMVDRTNTSVIVDPGNLVPSIEELIDAIDAAVASIPADYSSLWTSLAPAFSTSTNYTAGQYVTYNGAVYQFTVDHPAGSWNSAHVTATNLGSEINSLKSAIINTNDYIKNPTIAKKTITTGTAWSYSTVFDALDLLAGQTYLFTFEKETAAVGGYAELYDNATGTKFYTVTLNNKTKATYEYTPLTNMSVKVKVGYGTADITCVATVGYKTGRLEPIEANVAQNTTDIRANATRISYDDKKISKSLINIFPRRNSKNTATATAETQVNVSIGYVTTGLFLFHIFRTEAISDDINIYRVRHNVNTNVLGVINAAETEVWIVWDSDQEFDKIGIQPAASNNGIVYTVEVYSMLDGVPLSTGDEMANNIIDIVGNCVVDNSISVGSYNQLAYNPARLASRNLFPVKKIKKIVAPSGYQFWTLFFDSEKKYLAEKGSWSNQITSDDVETYGASYVSFSIRNSSTPTADISAQAKTVQNGIVIEMKQDESGSVFANKYNLQFAPGYVTNTGGISPTGNNWYLVAICALNGAKKIYTNNYYNSDSIATIAFYGISNSDVLAVYNKPTQKIYDVPFGARFFAVSSNINDYENIVVEADHLSSDDKNEIVPNELNYLGGRILEIYNPYHDQHQNQYMGQLHSHSYGHSNPEDDTPERLEDYYDALVEKGYDFGTVTNYYRVSHNPKPSGSLVWLFDGCEQGYSNEENSGSEPGHHIVMWNTPTSQSGTGDFANYPSPFVSVQDVLRIYKDTAMLDLAHPMWVSTFLNDTKAKKIKGLHYTEVFSGGIGQPYSKGTGWTGNADDAWNRLLTAGNYCFAIGNADGHNAEDWYLGLGNVKVFASAKTWQAIYDSFIKGNFYAASNVLVSISGVSYSNGVYSVDTGDATATTYFYGKGRELLKTQTGQNVSYTLEGDEGFVYARVVFPSETEDSNVAYTQPVFICGVHN